MVINEVRYGNRIVELCLDNVGLDCNVFTVVVGRNGCGKSTLLQKICSIFISSFLKNSYRIKDLINYEQGKEETSFDETGCLFYKLENEIHELLIKYRTFIQNGFNLDQLPKKFRETIMNDLHLSNRNTDLHVSHLINGKIKESQEQLPKIIAVSSSPFDKFLLIDESRWHRSINLLEEVYVYRGARTNVNSRKSYTRSKFDQLGASFINFFLKPEKRTNELVPLFSYLGIREKFTVKLNFPFHFSFDQILSEQGDGSRRAVESARFFKGMKDNTSLTDEDIDRIKESVKELNEGLFFNSSSDFFRFRNEPISIELDIYNPNNFETNFLKDFSVLASYDLIDLVNIEFTKEDNSKFFLTDASSGELCILFNILAIAGAISDNSVILLDEPELSLHPEWQREFIPLVKEVFSQYKKCHFILATHSPHIVSSLPSNNSFVVNLETNPAKAISGGSFSLRSSDYQLAETFNSPGHKNEYLISQLVEVLSQLSDGKEIDENFLEKIKNLIKFDSLVNDTDPVKKLLATLKKALEVLQGE
ncbi:AAA family ATPase [Litoribacillus peritrichatus]|uniref:AAA+ ATPase domain-containing protein n=1 Tax=Litoribacillus peritrichatus TaxID=718191 RepID=A0ABP7M9L2_9GAMM